MKRLIPCLFVVATVGHAADHAIENTVERALAWEKRWYGSYFGEACVKRRAKDTISIKFKAQTVSRRIGSDCTSGSPIVAQAQTFVAFVDQAGIFLTGQTEPYAFAVVSDGEARPDCNITEDDLRTSVSAMTSSSRITLPQTNARDAQRPSTRLDSFIARTVAAYARREQIYSSSVVVGDYHEGDPFIVAQIDSGAYLLVEVPGFSQISNQSFCGLVYNEGRFVGRSPLGTKPPDDTSILGASLERSGRRITLR